MTQTRSRLHGLVALALTLALVVMAGIPAASVAQDKVGNECDVGSINKLPMAEGWTKHRILPAPEGATFMKLYKRRLRKRR